MDKAKRQTGESRQEQQGQIHSPAPAFAHHTPHPTLGALASPLVMGIGMSKS
jgi:hypothetical protein